MINSTMNSNETTPLLDPDEEDDIKNYVAFKIKIILDQGFFPVFVPIGFVGNVLSFLVMTQHHNRHMSIAFYISVLAVTDNITLVFGLLSYLGTGHLLIPASPVYCAVRLSAVFTSSLCGIYLILAMTFDRFYGIIKPHRASSVNTVRRAKITCFVIMLLCTLFNVPHMFLYVDKGYLCIPYSRNMEPLRGEFYYWLSFVVNYSFPFAALLIMNSFIIHTIRSRKNLSSTNKNEKNVKTSERQIFTILLLVTFSFLLLTTPAYMYFLFSMIIDFGQSPKQQAYFQLFFSASQKTWYTNNGINFFLYILSGTKFRNDFINLFQCCSQSKMSTNQSLSMNTLSTINSGSTDKDGAYTGASGVNK